MECSTYIEDPSSLICKVNRCRFSASSSQKSSSRFRWFRKYTALSVIPLGSMMKSYFRWMMNRFLTFRSEFFTMYSREMTSLISWYSV